MSELRKNTVVPHTDIPLIFGDFLHKPFLQNPVILSRLADSLEKFLTQVRDKENEYYPGYLTVHTQKFGIHRVYWSGGKIFTKGAGYLNRRTYIDGVLNIADDISEGRLPIFVHFWETKRKGRRSEFVFAAYDKFHPLPVTSSLAADEELDDSSDDEVL
jgi:hypothetical protein